MALIVRCVRLRGNLLIPVEVESQACIVGGVIPRTQNAQRQKRSNVVFEAEENEAFIRLEE